MPRSFPRGRTRSMDLLAFTKLQLCGPKTHRGGCSGNNSPQQGLEGTWCSRRLNFCIFPKDQRFTRVQRFKTDTMPRPIYIARATKITPFEKCTELNALKFFRSQRFRDFRPCLVHCSNDACYNRFFDFREHRGRLRYGKRQKARCHYSLTLSFRIFSTGKAGISKWTFSSGMQIFIFSSKSFQKLVFFFYIWR